MAKLPAILPAILLIGCVPALQAQDQSSHRPFSPEQLDNLLAQVALYPDPLLAQILPAATFPDQIDDAAQFCRAGGNPDDIDVQPWDVSVKALAHYPPILYMMADNLDWTTALGQAYVNQGDAVMAAIQRLRQEASDAGNLVNTPQQQIVDEGGAIEIWPAEPQYCYIPVYDPGLVYFGSGGVFGGPIIAFRPPYKIGAWLNHNLDWQRRRVYYHGWSERRGWVPESLPYVHLNPVYVNPSLATVRVNRAVTARPVNFGNLERFSAVHAQTGFGPSGTAAAGRDGGRYTGWRRVTEQPEISRSVPSRPAVKPARPAEGMANSAFASGHTNANTKPATQTGKSSPASHPSPAKPSGGGSHSSGGGSASHSSSGGGGSGGGGSHSSGSSSGSKH